MTKSLSLSKHILVLFYNNPVRVFSVDEILKVPILRRRQLSRQTLNKCLRRFLKLKLIEKIILADHKTYGYRLLNAQLAHSYINADQTRPWLYPQRKLTLKPPSCGFPQEFPHRVRYLLQLSKEELAVAKRFGEYRPNVRTGGSYVLNTREFCMVVNVRSGKGEIFLNSGWERAIFSMFGGRLASYLEYQVSEGKGRREISLPVEFKNKRIRVGGSEIVWAGSHAPIEIDVQGDESDTQVINALQLLTDSIKFNDTILRIDAKVTRLEEGLIKMADAFEKLRVVFEKMTNVFEKSAGTQEQPYAPTERNDNTDISYR